SSCAAKGPMSLMSTMSDSRTTSANACRRSRRRLPRLPAAPVNRMRLNGLVMMWFGSAHQARALVVEGPARDQELHRDRVVARAQAHVLVRLVRLFQFRLIEFDAQARLFGHAYLAALDPQRLFGESLAV